VCTIANVLSVTSELIVGHGAKSFHEKADRSQDGFVFLSVDPNLFTEPPLSPSFHPQSVMSDDRSLPVGRP